jgi:penicillin-binding protein
VKAVKKEAKELAKKKAKE